MCDYKIGFIGAGNIATAIFGGIISSGYIKPENVYVFDTAVDKSEEFISKGAHPTLSASELTEICDFVFLTVKPQIYSDVLSSIKEKAKDTCFVDVAAGISIAYIKDTLGFDAPVIRVMPNTPLMYGLGSSALVKQAPVTDEQFDFVRGCFDSCGVTCVVDEEMINTVIAVSGSAPAYVMKLAKAFIDYAVANGLCADDAEKLVLQVFTGCAKMVSSSEKSIGELIAMVTSPKGTTEAGLASLTANSFDNVIFECLDATVKRAEELSR